MTAAGGRRMRFILTIASVGSLILGPVGGVAWAQATKEQPPLPSAPPLSAYTVEATADPVLLEASLPTVLPLDVALGIAHTGVKIDNQPLVVIDAAPLYVPLTSALGVLGGVGGLNDLVTKLLPNIVVGLPTIIGQPKFNLDPAKIPIPKLPDLTKVPFDDLGCIAYAPGLPHEASCGGVLHDLAGLAARQASGNAAVTGDTNERTSIQTVANSKVLGISHSSLPISVGSLSSSVTSKVMDGRIMVTTNIDLVDVNLLGILEFSRITAGSTAALGGVSGSSSFQQDQCSISKARAAGHAVSVEADGVHVTASGTPGVDVRSAQLEVDQLLGTLGVKVRSGKTTAPEVAPDGTSHTSAIDCVEVSWAFPASGSRVRVVIGQNVLKVSAAPPDAPIEPAPDGSGSQPRPVAFIGPDLRDGYPFFVLLVVGLPLLARARSASLRRR